jgi:hypothetical protein
MLKTSIHDQKQGHSLAIEDDGSINVYVIPQPPKDAEQITLPFAEYLSLNGAGLTTSMLIDGSVTNKEFYIKAKEYDTYINTLVFEIADASAALNQFGNLAALTNGLEFYYFNQLQGRYVIETNLKTNYDMVKLANFEPSFGTGAAAFQLTNAITAAEAYVGTIDLEDVFGLHWGLKLRAYSTDRVGFTVRDNITGIDAMTIKAYGIRV